MRRIITIAEYCPHCESEVSIPDDCPSHCPECNSIILPCSTCDEIRGTVTCDWTEENGCKIYPKVNGKYIGVYNGE